jgi:hypothetical protein
MKDIAKRTLKKHLCYEKKKSKNMPTLRATELLKQRYTELPLKRDLRKLLGKLPKDKK